MVLGIAEDFTSDVELDKGLTDIPASGLYINSGVHPSITVENLLAFLPTVSLTFERWSEETSYGAFEESRSRRDIVVHEGLKWLSLRANTASEPSDDSSDWLETNIDSLRIRFLLMSVKDRVISDLSLNKRLINNQRLYENGDAVNSIDGDYMGWVFEPKGSDYVAITVNEMMIQKAGVDPVTVHVVTGNEVTSTFEIVPDNGRVKFDSVDLTLPLDGVTRLVVESDEVYTSGGVIDPLRFDGFIAYSTIGRGASPESASYSYTTHGNGLGFNITAYLDASKYIKYNLARMGRFVRTVFEQEVFKVFQSNPNNRSNREVLIRMDDKTLVTELYNNSYDVDTVASRYRKQHKQAVDLIQKTFDSQLDGSTEGLDVETHSV